MEDRFSRTRMLLGAEALEKLQSSRVAIFGIGGVGGYVAEALCRSGIGTFDLIDNDKVCLSNLNRQIIATMDTLGRSKVEVMAERIRSINPSAVVHAHECFYLPETADRFDFKSYDYVVDAIDTVTGKIQLILQAKDAGTPVISSMGAGNKLDPAGFQVADIYETSVDPLARVMRRELKKRGVRSLKVVYSREKPVEPSGRPCEMAADPEKTAGDREGENSRDEGAGTGSVRRSTPGSIAFVPSVAGLIIAGEVVKDLISISQTGQPGT